MAQFVQVYSIIMTNYVRSVYDRVLNLSEPKRMHN